MPKIDIEDGTAGEQLARPGQIKAFTAIAAPTFMKAVDGEFLPDASLATVLAAGRLPLVRSLRNDAGTVGIPFVRMDVASDNSDFDDDLHVPPRPYHGVAQWMSDDEFFAGATRWWRHSGREGAVASGFLVVVLGGFSVGLIEVDGYNVHSKDPDRIEYLGRLVARVDDLLGRRIRVIGDVSAEVAEFARSILATRSTTAGGGVVAPLDADTKMRIAAGA